MHIVIISQLCHSWDHDVTNYITQTLNCNSKPQNKENIFRKLSIEHKNNNNRFTAIIHHTRQLVLSNTCSEEQWETAGAKIYCPRALLAATNTFQVGGRW